MKREPKKYLDNINENIKKFGFHSTYVFSDSSPSFCYSTGIYKTFGIPEMFISSLPQNLSQGLIWSYVNMFKGVTSLPLNKRIDDLSDRFPIYLIDVPLDKLRDYVLSSIRFYKNKDFKYVQLVYPDTQGYFPNEEDYDYDQIIMGRF